MNNLIRLFLLQMYKLDSLIYRVPFRLLSFGVKDASAFFFSVNFSVFLYTSNILSASPSLSPSASPSLLPFPSPILPLQGLRGSAVDLNLELQE